MRLTYAFASRSRASIRAIGVVVAVLLLGMAAIVGITVLDTAQAASVNSCTTITNPGQYVLTTDIDDSTAGICIEIRSSDVVFHGQGHTIDGVNAPDSIGISANDSATLTNVTVRNVTVTEWGSEGIVYRDVSTGEILYATAVENGGNGVEVDESADISLHAIQAYRNDRRGLFIGDSTNTHISESQVENSSFAGITLIDTTESTIHNTTVARTDPFLFGHGIEVIDTRNTTITDTELVENADHGVTIRSGAEGIVVRNTSATRNVKTGIRVRQGSDILLRTNTVVGNSVGISVRDSSTITVVNNLATNNAAAGFHIRRRGVVRNNTATDNGGNGFEIVEGILQNNTATENGNTGIVLVDANATNNVATRNDHDGFRVVASENLTLEDNTARENGNDGFRLSRSNTTLLLANVAQENEVGINVTGFNGTVGFPPTSVTSPSVGTTIEANTITDNGDGIRLHMANATIIDNRLRDNQNGVRITDQSTANTTEIHWNEIAENAEFGVRNNDTSVVNATYNSWGALDGPGSPDDSDAPFEDPHTGTLADGAGDRVSEGPTTPGISNVHFDPFIGEEDIVYWQVDFGEGEDPPDPPAYWPDDLLSALGNSEDGVTENPSVRRQRFDGQLGDVHIEGTSYSFDDAGNPTNVTVRFSVDEGAESRTLHLAVFVLPGPFDLDEVDQQTLYEKTSITVDGGETAELTVSIPQSS